MDADQELSPQEISRLSQRDVRYLLESEPLLLGEAWQPGSFRLSEELRSSLLSTLTQDPWPTSPPLPMRVGRYAESLLKAVTAIENETFQTLAQNLQIFENRQTIGELDLVTKHAAGILHVELAVKLYLGLPEFQTNLDGWVGPNPRDTLGKKYRHLRDKQLPLSNMSAARAALGLEPDQELMQRAWVKGYLFHHHGEEPSELPALINREHHQGWWTLNDEGWEPEHRSDYLYCIPQKPFWIHSIPRETQCYRTWKSLCEAAAPQISKRLTAHVVILSRDTETIVSRGFIASRDWLHAAEKLARSLIS